ncbi:hypothetical protein EV426DRAFT_186548 [Tirmania nivea]|nr:hypothetical protein EV426DRAFT_186548 [Tirmania nivea]
METVNDIFDPLLSLEEHYYDKGYNEGLRDGEKAGLIEGRLFGLEKGFDKFFELGRLQGRVSVWKARIPSSGADAACAPITNPRLIKQIHLFENIISSLPTANDEESVEEVEGSLRRGKAKMKIVSNMIGEKEPSGKGNAATDYGSGEPSIEEGNFNKNVRR